MAIPLSQLPSSTHAQGVSRAFPVTRPPIQGFLPQTQTSTVTRLATTRPAVIGKIRPQATRNDYSMSTTLRELEKQEQEEDMATKEEQDPNQGLAHRWREVNGVDDWTGMLDPIDPLLRSELIRYGELSQACYDAFDSDPFSKYCGTSKYECRHFFDCLGLAGVGYEVTHFIYSTANVHIPKFFLKSLSGDNWSQHANWIGYVAVARDEATSRLGRRDIVVAWRGTVTRLEWLKDLMASMGPVKLVGIPSPDLSVKAEWGFISLYVDKDPGCPFCMYSAREQVLTEVRRLVELYTNRGEEVSISVTGHSLGSAMAVLSAYDLAETKVNVGVDGRAAPVCVISFSGPRVGNRQFRERFEKLGVKALRVVNVHDMVPYAPGLLVNEHVPRLVQMVAEWLPVVSNYNHVGVELTLDHTHSPFLKETNDLASFHNLEVHLHLLDGYHGKGERFVLTTKRDHALVNKASNFLKDHYLIPPYWWQDENKGMIRNRDGHWMKPERPRIDDDRPDIHHHLIKLGLISDQQQLNF